MLHRWHKSSWVKLLEWFSGHHDDIRQPKIGPREAWDARAGKSGCTWLIALSRNTWKMLKAWASIMHGLVNQSCSLPYGRRCNSEKESQPRSDNTGYILRRNRGGLGCWRISLAAEKNLHLFSNSTCHPNMCNRLEIRTNERFMQSRKVFRGKCVVLL